MNLYDVIVRVGGSLYNEVERFAITAPEVVMLQALHGEDSVKVIRHAGTSDESNAEIRERMADFYGTGRSEDSRSGALLVTQHFGPKSMPLPEKVDGVPHFSDLPPARPAEITSLTA